MVFCVRFEQKIVSTFDWFEENRDLFVETTEL